MNEKITRLTESMKKDFNEVSSIQSLQDLKVKYMGKKGSISELSSGMRDLSNDEKREVGQLINEVRTRFNDLYEEKKETLETEALNEKLACDTIDVTLDSTKLPLGATHPIERIKTEICDLFISMGYSIEEGPEVEQDLYNFEKLNLPKNHPARDAQDSFYVTEEFLLRTHTSPVQARSMEKNSEKGPLRIICPGKTYRRDDDDATHSHQFGQLEGLVIDKDINLGHLKGTLEEISKKMFGENLSVRFRPSYFPFTEPSIELDISCFKCGGVDSQCRICKGTGWIEIGGAGMVHPNVLEMSGYNSKKYTAFAFGMGFERIAMLKYGVNDIRSFYTNDLRFLKEFNRKEGGE